MKIKNIEDLKLVHRKELKQRSLILFCSTIFYLFLFLNKTFTAVTLMILATLLQLFYMIYIHRLISRCPRINEISDDKLGDFSSSEIIKLVEDVSIRMDTKLEFEVRIILDKQIQAFTFLGLHKRYFKNNIIILHLGLLHVLSEPELKAVIAHEIGHHFIPRNSSNILREYWADFYACKYEDPVAMANALIKIDQHTYLFYVCMQRCMYMVRNLLGDKYINQKFWEYFFKEVQIPFKSKRYANKAAKELVSRYMVENQIPQIKRNYFTKLWFAIKNKFTGDILNRKKLSKICYVDWTLFDNRIKNNYLDKYELINMLNVIKDERMTVNRFFFFDFKQATHPNTNRRLLFIIENFFL